MSNRHRQISTEGGSGRPLYHGTRRPFQAGGLLVPRSQHGDRGSNAPLTPGATEPADAADHVYMTGDLNVAWAYAWMAPGRGRPRVLEVRPLGAVDRDPEHSAAMDAWRTDAARVVAVLTKPAITEREAQEGWKR